MSAEWQLREMVSLLPIQKIIRDRTILFFSGRVFPSDALSTTDFSIQDPIRERRGALNWYLRLVGIIFFFLSHLLKNTCHFRLLSVSGFDGNFVNGIEYADFSQGLTVFAIPLSIEKLSRDFVPPPEQATMTLMVDFETPLQNNVLLNIIGCFPETISLQPMTKMINCTYFPGTFG
ncbi:MAG: hypothetical protein GY820_26790 [Gammaproteobacteria bacterium]|nr:hypothetical protein [Gammaproteobacteria bacterium]